MTLLLFWQPKLLPAPRFKACKRCGAICEVAISVCPGLIPINKKRRFLIACKSKKFQEVTCSMAEQGVGVYFQTWPTWPDPGVWRQVSAKDDMEKSSKTKKPAS
jgi:hypothetical protein